MAFNEEAEPHEEYDNSNVQDTTMQRSYIHLNSSGSVTNTSLRTGDVEVSFMSDICV